MGLSVNFKTNRGIVYDRKFLPGEGLSIYGKATTLNGVVNPGTLIQVDVKDDFNNSLFYQTKFTDLFGDYDFWFVAPNENKRLTLTMYASYPISGQDKTIVPLAVGNINPRPVSAPESEFSLLNILPIAMLGLAAVILLKK